MVVINNITDYWTNFAFVADVLDIDQIFPQWDIRWRAIRSPIVHHVFYVLIIVTEFVVAALTFTGALAMTRVLKASAEVFQQAKSKAIAGLTLGFLLYEGGFVAVPGECFGMWQAQAYDAVPGAFRILMTMLGVLIFISFKGDELA